MVKLHSSPQVIEPEVTFPEDGSKATISHQTSGLEDGLHTAVIEIVDENGNVTGSMQKIFFVDTKPPVLELIEPSKETILPGQKSFLVKFSDEGLGIDILLKG